MTYTKYITTQIFCHSSLPTDVSSCSLLGMAMTRSCRGVNSSVLSTHHRFKGQDHLQSGLCNRSWLLVVLRGTVALQSSTAALLSWKKKCERNTITYICRLSNKKFSYWMINFAKSSRGQCCISAVENRDIQYLYIQCVVQGKFI
jgi:hypothetical protein